MSEQAVMQRPPRVMSRVGLAAALALALWAWLSADHEVVDVAGGKANAKPGPQSAGSPASLYRGAPATPETGLLPATLGAPSATTGPAVPITVALPKKVIVGDMNDLVIGMGANAGVNEISFTVQFDANVLQVRAGTQGDWAVAPGQSPRFAPDISTKEDRVQIRSTVSGERVGMAGGSVAIVQFQAVAPGATSVTITDVVVKDLAGRPIATAFSASDLQVIAESVPPQQLEAWRRRSVSAVAVEPPTETTQDGD